MKYIVTKAYIQKRAQFENLTPGETRNVSNFVLNEINKLHNNIITTKLKLQDVMYTNEFEKYFDAFGNVLEQLSKKVREK